MSANENTAPVEVISETSLKNLTLEQLAAGIQAASKIAKDADEPAWALLSKLAAELTAEDRDDTLVSGYRWALTEVQVEGFRGVHDALSVDLDSGPSVTVLHGENGSGKSSITEALRMALEGQVGLTHLGTKGHVHQLWGSSDERSTGVASALVVAKLRDASNPAIT